MLIEKFIRFVNFAVVNSHFSPARRICKHPFLGRNRCFGSAPGYFKTQTNYRFQSRIQGWQNTIFAFLDAQLDFLAFFFTTT